MTTTSMTTRLRGPALVDEKVVPDAVIEIAREHIVSVVVAPRTSPGSSAAAPVSSGVTVVSGTMAPGFVDIHCHGGGGSAFTDLDAEAAAAAARHHHARGTTSLLASLVTMAPADLERGVAVLADLADDGLVDGVHLEGPWLAEARCGAHDPALLRDPSLAEVERLLEIGRGHVRQVTLAPERDHGLDLVRWLTQAGVHAAVGHTTASFELVGRAVEAGADLATHLFNGMDPWHHRHPGAVPALMREAARGTVTLELIADGTHLDDDTVRTVIDLVGPARVAFVSDAMAAAGVGDGRYGLGGRAVVVTGGVARLEREADGVRGVARPDAIAGGTSHVADLVSRAMAGGLAIPDAVQCGSSSPAALLGLADRGSLSVGSRADLVVLDDSGATSRVMRAGRWLGPGA